MAGGSGRVMAVAFSPPDEVASRGFSFRSKEWMDRCGGLRFCTQTTKLQVHEEMITGRAGCSTGVGDAGR